MTPTLMTSSSAKAQCCDVNVAKRIIPTDISSPKHEDLVKLAVLRVIDAAFPLENRPPRLFPTTETVFSRHFSSDVWLLHGDMETELGRMNYLLTELPERSIPSRYISTTKLILSSSAVLAAWQKALPQLRRAAATETDRIIAQMQTQREQKAPRINKSDFITVPVDYETDTAASVLGLGLWRRALEEIATFTSRGQFEHVPAFLQIFSYLKDPLGGLEPTPAKAVDLFIHFAACITTLTGQTAMTSVHQAFWQAAMAQAAQEAMFLADSLLENVEYVHFSEHQQLSYVYVELDQLPRSEFSIPQRVLRIVEEIILSAGNAQDNCFVAPIAVSTYPVLPIGCGRRTIVVIDGNHRATATMILRFIAEWPGVVTNINPHTALNAFCVSHGLEVKWQVDLRQVIDTLCENLHYLSLIQSNMDAVKRFRSVSKIPALVVREDNFHTVCQQRTPLANRPRLLLPIHQAIYNDESHGFAFPRAGQVHGRAVGFKPMPLLPNRLLQE
jgi:hypothetical protein